MDKIELAQKIISDHTWYHSIELAPGCVTPGSAPLSYWEGIYKTLELGDLQGKSVLDIGAWDGFFAFEAERHGASHVVAMDDYVWASDFTGYASEVARAKELDRPVPAPHETQYWHLDTLPGKRPFDAVHDYFDSKVEALVGHFTKVDPSQTGLFDIVLFLGVLYHMEDPVGAMRRAASFLAPGGLIVVETAAVEYPLAPDVAMLEFYPDTQLNNDPTNWFAPNIKALVGLATAAGLGDVRVVQGPPTREEMLSYGRVELARYRAIISGRRPAL
jgi:tRNA (mo5U34)-methyltransferase